MYANLAVYCDGLPFADLCGNSSEIIIRNFHCQFVPVRIETRSQNQLVDLTSANKVGAWRVKVQQVTFLQRFVVSLFPAWDNCSKVGW